MSSNQENKSSFKRSLHDKKNPYAQISREMLHDRSISPAAKGLLCYLLSLPQDWQIYHSQLQNALNVGEFALNTMMDELIAAGYAKRSRPEVKGKFLPYQYEIAEFKIFLPDEVSRPGPPGPENSVILKKEQSPSEIEKEVSKKDPLLTSPPAHHDWQAKENLLKEHKVAQSWINSIRLLVFTMDELKAAITCATNYGPRDLGSYLHKAIKEKWQPNKPPEDIEVKNKEFVEKNLRSFDGAMYGNYKLTILSKCIEFAQNANCSPVVFEFSHRNFEKDVTEFILKHRQKK